MSKINSNLQLIMKSKPNDKLYVLITLKDGVSPKIIDIKDYYVLMDNIVCTKINPKTIEKLSSKSEVIAIELDSEMGIL